MFVTHDPALENKVLDAFNLKGDPDQGISPTYWYHTQQIDRAHRGEAMYDCLEETVDRLGLSREDLHNAGNHAWAITNAFLRQFSVSRDALRRYRTNWQDPFTKTLRRAVRSTLKSEAF